MVERDVTDSISATERAELIALGTGAHLEVPFATAIDDVDRHASERGHARGLEAEGDTYTYVELRAEVDRVARLLASRGVARGGRVGVALEREAALVVTMLALFRLGATYVPLDVSYPESRLAYVVENAGCGWVVVGRDGAAPFAGPNVQVVDLGPRGAAGDATPLPTAARPEDVAYVIYTSGSTGAPKGVEVQYGPLRNLVASKVLTIGMGPEDVQTAVMSIAFDASIFEMLLPIYAGGRLVMATRGEVESGPQLAAKLRSTGTTVLGATPATWRALLAAGWVDGHPRTMMVGGEALPTDLARRLAPKGRVFNMYGLTETVITSLAYEVPKDWVGDGATAPIGRPLHNVLARVVDERGRMVPRDAVGELMIGAVLAAGYRARGDLTAQRFVTDASPDLPGRWYRTGDQARVRRDGQFEFLGRNDDQVKIRGVRIELAEIEAALAEQPGVDAAVVVKHGDGEEARLAAYLTGARAPDGPALRRALAARLPPAMIPSALVHLDAFPLTPNGKIDRKGLGARPLPAGSEDDGAAAETYASPLEQEVAVAVSEQLGGQRVPRETDFAFLGLDSVGRARLRVTLANAGYDVTHAELQRHPNVAALATLLAPRPKLTEKRAEPTGPIAGEVDPASFGPDVLDAYPATNNQKHPCLLSLANPGTGIWNCQIACSLHGPLAIETMRAAWQAVLDRHDALRTSFRWRAGLPRLFQAVERRVELPFRVLDLRATDPVAYGRELATLQEREIASTFPIEKAPLFALVVVQAPDGSHDLVWTYHSSIIDGWSSAIVIREVMALYDQLAQGKTPSLAPAPRYRSHIQRMAAVDPAPGGTYFQKKLTGFKFRNFIAKVDPGGDADARSAGNLAAPLTALFDALDEKPFFTDGSGASMVTMTETARARLRAFVERHRLAVNTVLQAAWALVLMRETGQPDALFGMVAANRTNFVSAVGKYTNLLPFRVQAADDDRLVDWLRSHENDVLDTLGFESTPHTAWFSHLGLKPWDFPFESTFTFVNYGSRAGGVDADKAVVGGVELRDFRQVDRGVPPSLGLVIIPGEELIMRLEYNKSVGLDAEMVGRLLEAYVATVDAVIASPADRRVRELLEIGQGRRGVGVPLRFLG